MMNILTDYYKGQRLTDARSRFDIVASTGEYPVFEKLLHNERKFNVGGLSFSLRSRPCQWKDNKTELVLTKGGFNITSVKRPEKKSPFGFGDINRTYDSCLICFNRNFETIGIVTVEIFIARGKTGKNEIWHLLKSGILSAEIDNLRRQANLEIYPEKLEHL